MSDERLAAIAERLLELSRKGDAEWKETADGNKFSVSYPGSSVSIQKVDTGYILWAYNQRGTEVESLRALPDEEEYELDVLRLLGELFQLARRIGTRTDDVLDELLERLSGEETPV